MNGQDLLFIVGMTVLFATVIIMLYIAKLDQDVKQIKADIDDWRSFQRAVDRVQIKRRKA